jgi:IS4 transposase
MLIPNEVFEKMEADQPLPLMVWNLLEQALPAQAIDVLFEQSAVKQYTRKLLYSDIVALMSLVVTGVSTSLHAAFKKRMHDQEISLAALYGKLNRLEPHIGRALLQEVNTRLFSILDRLNVPLASPVPGYRTRILDGNAIAATDHRLDVLRDTRSGPLPGKSLVILDPQRQCAVDIIPCEDGYTQERALLVEILPVVQYGDCWIADRNFCTTSFLAGLDERKATYIIREHAKFPSREVGKEEKIPGTELSEEHIVFSGQQGDVEARRITLKLPKKTRDGAITITVITNLPTKISADIIMEAYRARWSIETLFQMLTTTLRCEVSALGYPRAALFAFTVALISANVTAVVRAGIRAAHGEELEAELSNFYLIGEIQQNFSMFSQNGFGAFAVQGRSILPLPEFADWFVRCAKNINLKFYKKARGGNSRTRTQRGTPNDPPHVSTARLLAERQNSMLK